MIKFFVNGKGREKVKKNSKIKKSCLLNSVFFLPDWLKHINAQFPSRRTCGQFDLLQGVSLLPRSWLIFFNNKAFSNVAQTLFDFYFSIDESPSKASLLRLKVLGDPFSKVSANV